uniref:DDE Tnp4 domain-containing protein n=1 Tax=Amphimedon queenslandica TaxID=400682 RepID=A0A1X7TWB2_AMPQE
VPTTTSKWKEIATGFETYWQFPHCIGALDGKHIVIRPPPNSGSYYFNYKHTFSIVLLALVDADYKFTYVNIGCNGRNSSLCAALETNSLNVPLPFPICEDGIPLPYMIVADEAFPLKTYIQKPYAQIGLTKEKRIFNYCLSRARRIVENAFGILANRFQVFMTPIRLSPDKAETIVLACCSLHNFLRSSSARHVYHHLEALMQKTPLLIALYKDHGVLKNSLQELSTLKDKVVITTQPRLKK